jgi:hypothetical protein
LSNKYIIAPVINERLTTTIAKQRRIGNNLDKKSITSFGRFLMLTKMSKEKISLISVILREICGIVSFVPG